MINENRINRALFTARRYQLENPGGQRIIGVSGDIFNPETGMQEEMSFYYADAGIVYQCDNCYRTANNDIDFVRDYKVYNLLNIYSDAEYIEISIDRDIMPDDNDRIFSRYFCEHDIFEKLHHNLLNPQGRLILHLDNYYIENSEMFFEAGFDHYGQYFYHYLEKHFPPNPVFLRKSYVRYLEQGDLEEVFVRLRRLEKEFELNEFDAANMAYIYKMREDFENACKYYALIDLEKRQEEYLYNDYIYCLKMSGRKEKALQIEKLRKEYYGGAE